MARKPLKKFNTEAFLFKLYLEKEILFDYEKGIIGLFSQCRTTEEADLVKHIVSQLCILSAKQAEFALRSMFAKIVEFSKGKRTAVVAVSAGLDPDSSHLIAQLIKPFMADNAEIHLYNGISAFQKKLTNYDLCLLIDEFSGTGATITQRFNYVFKDAKGRGHNLDIKVLLISAMEKAMEFIKENGISVSVEKTLRAGLSSHFIEEDLKQKIDIMRLFEQGLAAKFNDADIPSLGYGEAEALYSVQNWNAPNSNFPILWWPYDDKGKKRAVIFRRGAP